MNARGILGSITTLATLALAGPLTGCSSGVDPDVGGGRNQPCQRSTFDARPCDRADLVCDEDRICRDCGGPGELCCRFNTCTGGNECRSNAGVPTCGDCGEEGEACCPSDTGPSCASGFRCNTASDVCEAPMSDPCTGSTPRLFWGRGTDGCATPATVAAAVSVDDFSAAQDCARAILGVADVREEAPTAHDTCERSPFFVCEPQQRWAYDEDDARSCARAVCGSDCDIVLGDCPVGGICS